MPNFEFKVARSVFKDLLSKAENEDISEIQNYVSLLKCGDTEKKVALEQSFRDRLQTLIMQGSPQSNLTAVVALSIVAAQENICSPSMPFLLLTDVFDSVTIDICNEVFQFVEEKVAVWKSPPFYISGKNYLLRMSNDLLRRLSKAHDTVFCGRIQLFLAKFFPLDEKSGLNLMSNFNKENVTMYNKDNLDGPIIAEEKDDSMEYEEGEMREGASSSHVDYQQYRKFWSLQDFFRDPVQCYTKEKWKNFMKNTRSVLSAFSSMKLEPDSYPKKDAGSSKKVMTQSGVFFAKYLTSEKLFDLQLSDANFRRYVLIQFLILFQYLNQQVKFKGPTLILTDEMQIFMKTTTEKVYDLLGETPPDGQKFATNIKKILDREEYWNAWKNEGCPSFVKEKPKDEQELRRRPRKRTLGEEMELNANSKRIDMGSPELTRLWNQCPDNLEACMSEKRTFQPTLEEFFEEAIEQADPEAMIEPEYKAVNNSNYAWQALRLLARKSPHFFQTAAAATQPSIKTIPAYLELMATKLAKEMPQNNAIEEIKTEALDNDELLKAGEEDNEVTRVSPEDMELVATKLGTNWKTLAAELAFTEDEIASTETEFPELKEQIKNILKSWEDKNGIGASKDAFLQALTESGLNDIVVSVFQKKKEVPKDTGMK